VSALLRCWEVELALYTSQAVIILYLHRFVCLASVVGKQVEVEESQATFCTMDHFKTIPPISI
jgi:hypothetical protein